MMFIIPRTTAAAMHTVRPSACCMHQFRIAGKNNLARKVAYISQRNYSRLPMNTVILFVPQQEAWVVERMGKFHEVLEPGLNILIPIVDRVRYVQSLKEIAIEISSQSAITSDNVTLHLDGVIYLRVVDAYKASYGVEDPEFAITQLAQTTTRSEIGKLPLDTVFKERDVINTYIVDAINKAGDSWGIRCMRYEIRNIQLPARVQEAMQMQVEAERRKRASILESEGQKMSEINVAEGRKQAQILQSEAVQQEQINEAEGAARAMLAKANARAKSLEMVARSLQQNSGGSAASLVVAEQYVAAFSELAKTTNTVLLPANTGDVASMVSQAMAVYKGLDQTQWKPAPAAVEPDRADISGGSEEPLSQQSRG